MWDGIVVGFQWEDYNDHVYWVNPLFLWPCSIAFCMFTIFK